MGNLHHGPISGKHRLPAKILPLRSNSYVNAEDWDDLVHAFTEPLKSSPLDEIILLLHTATPGSYARQQKHFRPVFYHRLDTLPELLLSTTPSALRTDATPTHQQLPRSDHGGQRQQKRIEIPEGRIAHGVEAEVAMHHEQETGGTQVYAAKVIQQVYRRHLEWKRAEAARKIQVAYRRYLKGKGVVREGIDEIQAYYWHLLRERSMRMGWSRNSQYYLLFRVPLAYILACLDVIEAFAGSEKKGAKKRVMTEDHRGLEEAMEALSQYRYAGPTIRYTEGLTKPPANSSKEQSRFRRNSPHRQNSTMSGL